MGELIPGCEANLWDGIGAPKNTPVEIIAKLNTEINTILADPKLMTRLADMGAVTMPTTVSYFGKYIADESQKWAKVIDVAGAKPE